MAHPQGLMSCMSVKTEQKKHFFFPRIQFFCKANVTQTFVHDFLLEKQAIAGYRFWTAMCLKLLEIKEVYEQKQHTLNPFGFFS